MSISKEVKYYSFGGDSYSQNVNVNLDKDDDVPVRVCLKDDDLCKYLSIEEAKGLVKAINAALKELK